MRNIVLAGCIAAAVFVLWSSGQLPDPVASHFDSSGRPDGFMSRAAFVTVMLLAVTVIPGAVWLLQVRMARKRKTNIPNKDYWFSDEHARNTVQFLENHAAWFAVALAIFMSIVHWLVVRANIAQDNPGQLDEAVFLTVLALFLSFGVAWTLIFYVRFRIKRDRRVSTD